MTTYYVEYPRDFANEYAVYAVASSMEGRFLAAFPDARRITRKDAVHLGWSRPREAKRDGEQWYGGFTDHPAGGLDDATDVEGALAACRLATTACVEAVEAHRQGEAEMAAEMAGA